MDPHQLSQERSIAYHEVIAERLRDQPEILAGDPASIAAFLVARTELAYELRQSTPFAGALRPQERWRIFNETRERLSSVP